MSISLTRSSDKSALQLAILTNFSVIDTNVVEIRAILVILAYGKSCIYLTYDTTGTPIIKYLFNQKGLYFNRPGGPVLKPGFIQVMQSYFAHNRGPIIGNSRQR